MSLRKSYKIQPIEQNSRLFPKLSQIRYKNECGLPAIEKSSPLSRSSAHRSSYSIDRFDSRKSILNFSKQILDFDFPVGDGSFGVVWKATLPATGATFAVKQMKKTK